MVMVRDSHSKGRGFDSRRRILDGYFSHFIHCKNCKVCLKRPKINKKEARVGPFKKISGRIPVLKLNFGHEQCLNLAHNQCDQIKIAKCL